MKSEESLNHESLLRNFYEAFARGDADAMAASYHDQASFSDPVFPGLDAPQVRAMWKMLTSQATDLKLEFSQITADEQGGSAHWDAYYTFSVSGNMVHNSIDATFEFRDGLIYRHVDTFGFWRWSKQALGVPGLLMGWSPMLRGVVRKQAAKSLAKWQAKEAAAQ
ncbi:nuclear transport factor 2 family protein [Bradymonas sediminis]|uniref:Uncharacterized protein n=1 Tax=Bradymonas sediminis TaxID=1548548 RepID=A0A2Z4FIP5_9DELT|nr:nuclear transport factor 2 family protein [Bradymonas sediminis]AWV88907.1 hypothetical protein DN745_05965 [Bradymonas sediminis]TDP71914.1 ketosteroid isomerase-like protein [Bradymonas sediminis]